MVLQTLSNCLWFTVLGKILLEVVKWPAEVPGLLCTLANPTDGETF